VYGGTARFGDDANYVDVNSEGTITFAGDARVQKVIHLPLVGLGTGGTAPTLTRLGNYAGYAFTISDDSYFSLESPIDRAAGTDITLSLYWYINEAYVTNSGEVRWQVKWSATPDSSTEAVDAAVHNATVAGSDENIPATAKFLTKTSLTITGTNIVADDIIGLLISRIALTGGANPTAEPVIVRVEAYYTADKFGKDL